MIQYETPQERKEKKGTYIFNDKMHLKMGLFMWSYKK